MFAESLLSSVGDHSIRQLIAGLSRHNYIIYHELRQPMVVRENPENLGRDAKQRHPQTQINWHSHSSSPQNQRQLVKPTAVTPMPHQRTRNAHTAIPAHLSRCSRHHNLAFWLDRDTCSRCPADSPRHHFRLVLIHNDHIIIVGGLTCSLAAAPLALPALGDCGRTMTILSSWAVFALVSRVSIAACGAASLPTKHFTRENDAR